MRFTRHHTSIVYSSTTLSEATSDVFGGKKELRLLESVIDSMSPAIRLGTSVVVVVDALADGYGLGLGTRVLVYEEVAMDDDKDDLVLGVGSDESKLATSVVSNANVSHASVECNYGRNERLRVPSIGDERELARDSNANSLRDDCSEPFELRFGDGEKKKGKCKNIIQMTS
ncbi:hypothetical protein Tco_0957423 [Tanacetum coccineum]